VPTILYEQGFRFSFFAADGHEPPHVHVTKGGADAKWWLETVTEAYNHGFTRSDRSKIRRIITEYREFLLEEWRRFFEGGE
jgi:hypothetical protein